MRNGGVKFWLQLICLLIGLWMGVTGVYLLRDNVTSLFPGLTKWFGSGYASNDRVYYCVAAFEGAEQIGDTWEGTQAEDGYSFYRLQYTVTNLGDRYYYTDCPSFYYRGEAYDDVTDYWYLGTQESDVSSSPFEYYEQACIPVGRTATAYDVVLVRNGVTEFEASYYPNYEEDTQEIFLKITLE